jgi:hypothetical protein
MHIFDPVQQPVVAGVQPHVPNYGPPQHYTVLIHYRGMRSVRAVQPVEPFGPGRWRIMTSDGWLILSPDRVWDSVEAAIDQLFRELEASHNPGP